MRTLLPLFLLVILAGCSGPQPADSEAPPTLRRLTVVSLNDFHGAFDEVPVRGEPGRARGGLVWLAAAIEHLRASDPELLLLDGGDLFQGSGPVNATRGMAAVQAATLLGVDATVIGNHDFDYGTGSEGSHPLRGALEEAIAASPFPWLAANISVVAADGSTQPYAPPGLAPWVVIERSGIRVGLIGLSTTETPQTTLGRHVADLRFEDPVDTLRAELPKLREAGAEIVIVIGHLKGECSNVERKTLGADCVPDGEVARLLTELPEGSFDVLVVGHGHTFFAHRLGRSFVVEAGSRGTALSRLELVLGPQGVDLDASVVQEPWVLEHDAVDPGCEPLPFPMEPREVGGVVLSPSAEAAELVVELERTAGSMCDVIGCAKESLSRSELGESAVGNLVADAVLAVFPEAELAVQNPGGLRADLAAGSLRREHLLTVMPFENTVNLVEIGGAELALLLALGASHETGGHQIAGARYRFDPDCPSPADLDGSGSVDAWERGCVCWVEVGGKPLDPARRYRVALNNFMFDGGDNLGPALRGATLLTEGPLVRDAIVDYVGKHAGCVDEQPLVDPAQPRIEVGPCP